MALHTTAPAILGLIDNGAGKLAKARASLDRATTPEAVELAEGYLRQAAAELLAAADALPMEVRRMRRSDRMVEVERIRAAIRRTDILAGRAA